MKFLSKKERKKTEDRLRNISQYRSRFEIGKIKDIRYMKYEEIFDVNAPSLYM